MRSGNARATSANRVASSSRSASSTSIPGLGSSGIAGERIWCEGTEHRKVDCLGCQDIVDGGAEAEDIGAANEHREVGQASRRLAPVLLDDERLRGGANGVARFLAPDLAREIRATGTRQPAEERRSRPL